jgi:hypothetical protein
LCGCGFTTIEEIAHIGRKNGMPGTPRGTKLFDQLQDQRERKALKSALAKLNETL